MNKTILVTGGAGYNGSHAYKALAMHGYEPVKYDNLSRGKKWSVKCCPSEIGDILECGPLQSVLRKYYPIAVMYFAAFAHVLALDYLLN